MSAKKITSDIYLKFIPIVIVLVLAGVLTYFLFFYSGSIRTYAGSDSKSQGTYPDPNLLFGSIYSDPNGLESSVIDRKNLVGSEYGKKICDDGGKMKCSVGACAGTTVCRNNAWTECIIKQVCEPREKTPCYEFSCNPGYKICNECGSGYSACIYENGLNSS